MIDKVKIQVQNVSYAFVAPASEALLPVVKAVSFEVIENEVLCMVGPSGCGKTTLLKILAGLYSPLEGTLRFEGKEFSGPLPEIILLFQELHLFHWMNALGNVEFALQARGVSEKDRRKKALDMLYFVGLKGFDRYYPHDLSGGMRQKLALARALAADPAVLLMDEPFGSLDVETRAIMEIEFLKLHYKKKFTTFFVTHDIRQAIFLGDRVLVMSPRPATIKTSLRVPFSHPREDSIRHTSEFHKLEDYLSNVIKSEG